MLNSMPFPSPVRILLLAAVSLTVCLPSAALAVDRRPVPPSRASAAGAASGGVDAFEPIAAIARWLDAAALKTPAGLAWPADPKDPMTVNATLYAGTPGVVLFYLEAEAAARRRPGYDRAAADSYREKARSGADELLARLDDDMGPGLYEGLSGIGFVLEEAYKATGEARYRQGFMTCLARIQSKASPRGKGIEWGSVTDIISGTAGTGLFLLYAADELKDKTFVGTAEAAADRLLALGKARDGGLDWPMDPSYPRIMPNFAHGTAGTAFFLARLYEAGGNKAYLDAAIAGARYLMSISSDACLIYHDEPDNKDLFYLGWCHGPVGTANLFVRLAKITGDSSWMTWVHKSARTLIESGIPDRQTPGFWNNAGICCGLAGMADFFRQLHRLTGQADYRAFSDRLAAKLMEKASREGGGLSWTQAEHRTRPDLLVAQTGLMQGAAGIGLVLLRRLPAEGAAASLIRLPDSAFF